MERKDKVIELIYAAIDEVNLSLTPENALKKSPDTLVIGGPTSLDSMGVLNFTIFLEEELERTFHETVKLLYGLLDGLTTENTEWTVTAVGKFIEEELDRLQANWERDQPSAAGFDQRH